MGRLNDVQRNQAVGITAAGMSYRQVAQRMNCTYRTIQRLMERNDATGSVIDRPRSGRPRITSRQQDRQIVLSQFRNRFQTAAQLARETRSIHGNRVSESTIRRRFRDHGLRSHVAYSGNMLTPERRRNRFVWCQQHLRWTQQQWQNVTFTDESWFCLNISDGRVRVWRRRGESYADCCVRQAPRWGGGRVMVWGSISWNDRTPSVVLDGNLTARRYVDEILQPVVLPFLARHPDITLFQQDNARPHSARLTPDFLVANNVNVLPWPAFLPDLSPIEHLWDQLGRRVYNSGQPNRQQLIDVLTTE